MPRTFLLFLACASLALSQKTVQHEGRDAFQLSSGKIDLVITKTGGAMASLVLTDDPKKLNPIWNPDRLGREAGMGQRQGPGLGHFLCVDGFGPTTKEEQAAGYQGHGEAHRLPMENIQGDDRSIAYNSRLPLVQEKLSRKVSVAPGEQVVLVETQLESELPFDRPILWAEHATIGAPFLGLGTVVVDQSVGRCQTKPYSETARGIRSMPGGVDFDWPVVKAQGKSYNLRTSPKNDRQMDHIGCLMDTKRDHVYVTALNTDEKLLIGYLFRRSDYAWVQHWMNYPANKMYSWGLEFGMQPYDMTKKEILALTPMFGAPTFRWLPAKSSLSTRFMMFLTKVPDGFQKVDDVRLEGGQLVIEDKKAGKKVTLASSRGL